MTSYRLWVLDLRGWKPFRGWKKPTATFKRYSTRDDAVAARASMPEVDDVHYNIAPEPEIKSRGEKRKPASAYLEPDPLGGRNHSADRRLKLDAPDQ